MMNGSWILIVVVGTGVGVWYLHKQGKISWSSIPWLSGIRLPKVAMIHRIPKMFEPKAETQVEKLKKQTEKEVVRAGELRSVLDAKRELSKVQAEIIRLQKEIDGVSAKSVERDKVTEKKAHDAESAKPRRL
jgi:hypothetical protein